LFMLLRIKSTDTDHASYPFGDPSLFHTLQRSTKREVIYYRHVQVKWVILRQVPDILSYLVTGISQRSVTNRDASFTDSNVAGDHLHCSAFPCTVWPQESKDLAGLHFEVEIVHGLLGSVFF